MYRRVKPVGMNLTTDHIAYPARWLGSENRKLLAILIAALVISRIIGSIVIPTYDDAFITFRYARNLAQGSGLVYQPGQWVLGVTGPAFAIFLALFSFFHLDLTSVATGLNILFDILTLVTTLFLFQEAFGVTAVVLFGLFFSLSPIMTRICVGGMEMDLFLLASLSAVLLYLKGFKYSGVCLAAVCYFIRPESLVLTGILIMVEGFSHSWKKALLFSAAAAGTLVPLLLVQYSFYGSVFPQSVLSKSRSVGESFLTVGKELVLPDVFCIVMMPLAVYAAVKYYRRSELVSILLWWWVGYVAAYFIVRPKIWSWYGEPVHYGEFVFAAVGVADLVKNVSRLKVKDIRVAGLAGGAVVLIWVFLLWKNGPSPVTAHIYGEIESWCTSRNVSKNSMLASDIGAIGYYSSAKVLDVAGLVWPEASAYSSVGQIVMQHHPDYLFLNSTRSNVSMMSRPPLNALYTPVRRFSVNRSSDLDLRPEKFEDAWSQDYILFSKNHR